MQTIEVDFEVYKALTVRRSEESVSYNDVIRDLLDLRPAQNGTVPPSTGGKAWICKGVSFPHGTEFRAQYKGQEYTGRVDDGAMLVDGERFTSPSPAAIKITGNSVNGWDFWEGRTPGSRQWKKLSSFR